MEKRIITISREFGSGGRTIGKLVAEHLGIRCYDAELIQKLAAESGFDETYIKEAGEYTPGGFLASAFADRSFGPTNEDTSFLIRFWTHSRLERAFVLLSEENKKSEPFSYREKVRIFIVWCRKEFCSSSFLFIRCNRGSSPRRPRRSGSGR